MKIAEKTVSFVEKQAKLTIRIQSTFAVAMVVLLSVHFAEF